MSTSSELKYRIGVAEQNQLTPSTENITREARYNIAPGTVFIPFTDTTERLAVEFASGNALGIIPYKVVIPYRRVGNPTGTLKVGLRAAGTDEFTLLHEWPISEPKNTGLITIKVEGYSEHAMVASDKISLEYTPSATDYIEIPSNGSPPAGFTSLSYNGSSYSATAAAISIKIVSKVVTTV